jgi:hypothetical protein
MSQPQIRVDFVQGKRIASASQVLVLAIGALALLLAAESWYRHAGTVAGLRLVLQESTRSTRREPSADRHAAQLSKAAADVVGSLSVPWGSMLDDLESANRESAGDIAILAIEPDRAHGKVTVMAEARSLVAALEYVKRLQGRSALRNALLQSHEVQEKSPEHPVRVQITADWRQKS